MNLLKQLKGEIPLVDSKNKERLNLSHLIYDIIAVAPYSTLIISDERENKTTITVKLNIPTVCYNKKGYTVIIPANNSINILGIKFNGFRYSHYQNDWRSILQANWVSNKFNLNVFTERDILSNLSYFQIWKVGRENYTYTFSKEDTIMFDKVPEKDLYSCLVDYKKYIYQIVYNQVYNFNILHIKQQNTAYKLILNINELNRAYNYNTHPVTSSPKNKYVFDDVFKTIVNNLKSSNKDTANGILDRIRSNRDMINELNKYNLLYIYALLTLTGTDNKLAELELSKLAAKTKIEYSLNTNKINTKKELKKKKLQIIIDNKLSNLINNFDKYNDKKALSKILKRIDKLDKEKKFNKESICEHVFRYANYLLNDDIQENIDDIISNEFSQKKRNNCKLCGEELPGFKLDDGKFDSFIEKRYSTDADDLSKLIWGMSKGIITKNYLCSDLTRFINTIVDLIHNVVRIKNAELVKEYGLTEEEMEKFSRIYIASYIFSIIYMKHLDLDKYIVYKNQIYQKKVSYSNTLSHDQKLKVKRNMKIINITLFIHFTKYSRIALNLNTDTIIKIHGQSLAWAINNIKHMKYIMPDQTIVLDDKLHENYLVTLLKKYYTITVIKLNENIMSEKVLELFGINSIGEYDSLSELILNIKFMLPSFIEKESGDKSLISTYKILKSHLKDNSTKKNKNAESRQIFFIMRLLYMISNLGTSQLKDTSLLSSAEPHLIKSLYNWHDYYREYRPSLLYSDIPRTSKKHVQTYPKVYDFYNNKIKEPVKANKELDVDINDFYSYYTIICPVSGVHEFVNVVCKKCKMDNEILSTQPKDYYNKYVKSYKIYLTKKIKLNKIKNTKIYTPNDTQIITYKKEQEQQKNDIFKVHKIPLKLNNCECLKKYIEIISKKTSVNENVILNIGNMYNELYSDIELNYANPYVNTPQNISVHLKLINYIQFMVRSYNQIALDNIDIDSEYKNTLFLIKEGLKKTKISRISLNINKLYNTVKLFLGKKELTTMLLYLFYYQLLYQYNIIEKTSIKLANKYILFIVNSIIEMDKLTTALDEGEQYVTYKKKYQDQDLDQDSNGDDANGIDNVDNNDDTSEYVSEENESLDMDDDLSDNTFNIDD